MLRAVSGDAGTAEPMDEWMLNWLARTAGPLVGQAPRVAAELLAQAVASSPAGSASAAGWPARLAEALIRIGDRPRPSRWRTARWSRPASPISWWICTGRWPSAASWQAVRGIPRDAGPGAVVARTLGPAPRPAARAGRDGRTSASARLEKAGRVATRALAAASEVGDNWAMGWALHVLTIVTVVQGQMTDALPLFDRALAVTQSDPALTDLRLLLQINKAVALGNLDQYEEALAVAGQARHLADQVGTVVRLAQAHAALGQLFFETGRWDDALAEVEICRGPEGTRRGLLRPRHRGRDLLSSRRVRRGAAPPRRCRPARAADRAPAYRPAGPRP